MRGRAALWDRVRVARWTISWQRAQRRARGGVATHRQVVGLILSLLVPPGGSALLLLARDDLALGSVLLLYLLGVVVISAVGGLIPGLVAATLSFGLANWFFAPPFYTLAVEGRDMVIELVVFAAVALVVATTVEVAARDRLHYQRDLDVHLARTRDLAAQDKVRAALLASVGHDLRTPLASVKLAVSSLRQTDVAWSGAARAQLLETIEDSTDRLSRLVANLLDMTRLRSDAVTVALAPVALDEVVLGALRTEDRSRVEVSLDDGLPLVLVDHGLLERVVENLVDNALRFSPPDARVEVCAREHARATEGHAAGKVTTIDLSVVDHGPGISPDRWDEVFVPFQRLDDRDSRSHVGLGLAIARGFAEAMSGELSPSTTPGGGLTMTLRLPVAGT